MFLLTSQFPPWVRNVVLIFNCSSWLWNLGKKNISGCLILYISSSFQSLLYNHQGESSSPLHSSVQLQRCSSNSVITSIQCLSPNPNLRWTWAAQSVENPLTSTTTLQSMPSSAATSFTGPVWTSMEMPAALIVANPPHTPKLLNWTWPPSPMTVLLNYERGTANWMASWMTGMPLFGKWRDVLFFCINTVSN